MEYRPIERQETYVLSKGMEPLYTYCIVRLRARDGRDMERTFSYLVGDLPIKVGDWVQVPFGRENRPQRGKVLGVMTCSAAEAPWPPQETKTVLKIVEEPETALLQVGTVSQTVSLPQTEPVPQTESVPQTGAVLQEEPEPQAKEPPPAAEEKRPVAAKPRRRIPARRIARAVAAVAAFAAVAGFGFWRYTVWDTAYTAANEQLLAGNYADCALSLGKVPSFFGECRHMRRLAAAGAALQTQTDGDAVAKAMRDLEPLADFADNTAYAALAEKLSAALAVADKECRYADSVKSLLDYDSEYAYEDLKSFKGYKDADVLCTYYEANKKDYYGSFEECKAAEALMKTIPTDYAGVGADKIALLRKILSERGEKWQKWDAENTADRKAGLPYVGMLEQRIHETKQLGKGVLQDMNQEKDADGQYHKEYVYIWRAEEGNQTVFRAVCKDGVVTKTEKLGGSAVWNGSKLRVKLEAPYSGIVRRPSGTQTEKTKENPYREAYDSPEDLYEDGDFEDLDEAYDAWENG